MEHADLSGGAKYAKRTCRFTCQIYLLKAEADSYVGIEIFTGQQDVVFILLPTNLSTAFIY